MSKESEASFFSDLMYLFKIVRDVGMIPIKVVIGLFNFIRWCQNFHETTRNRIREFNARIKRGLDQIEQYRKQAIRKNLPKPVLNALIRIRRYFTRMNRHGEEFISILDEYEKLKDLPYKDSNINRFHNLQTRIHNLESDTSKNGWKHKLQKMNDVIGNKKREVVVRNIVSNLDKDITNLQNDISALRKTKSPNTKFIEQGIIRTLKNSRDLKEKEKRHGRLTRANSFDRIIKTTENAQSNFQDTEVSRKINDLIAQSNRMETIEDAKKVLTQVKLLSQEINKSPIYSESSIILNDLKNIKTTALRLLQSPNVYKAAEITKKLNDLKEQSKKIKTEEEAKYVLRELNLLSRETKKSPFYSKSTFIKDDLNEIKQNAESKLKELSPQSKKPWYRRFYFGDENLENIQKDYYKYKNQKSSDLSFGAVNRIKELRQKIKSIIKKTYNTKFINRLKKMNHRLKQKLLKRQRLLQQ